MKDALNLVNRVWLFGWQGPKSVRVSGRDISVGSAYKQSESFIWFITEC